MPRGLDGAPAAMTLLAGVEAQSGMVLAVSVWLARRNAQAEFGVKDGHQDGRPEVKAARRDMEHPCGSTRRDCGMLVGRGLEWGLFVGGLFLTTGFHLMVWLL